MKLPIISGGGYNILFAGSLKKRYVDAQYTIDLFSDSLLRNCMVNFYSTGNGIDAVKSAAAENIVLNGWVDKTHLEKAYEKTDAFISIAEQCGKQISSKIFEYMSTGKPIIHFYYADDDVNVKYLNKYGKSLCIKAESKDIQSNRLLIALFLLGMVGTYQNIELCEDLLKCTPESIYKSIDEMIS